MSPNLPPAAESTRTTENHPLHTYPPVWTRQGAATPHDFQERHSPSENTCIALPETKKPEPCRRRILDSRLWESLSTPQQTAAHFLYLSFELMTKGMGYTQSNWAKLPGSKGVATPSDAQALIVNTYIAWVQKCQAKRISHAMILDILCFGKSCRTVDKERRVRKGTARQNLTDGLDLYCEIRKWL